MTGSAPIRSSISIRAASSTDTMGSTVMTRFVMMSPAVRPSQSAGVAVAASFVSGLGRTDLRSRSEMIPTRSS
jgi:hypothetical protein